MQDHFRKAGEICFADVNRDGTGIIEFEYKDDMKYAVRPPLFRYPSDKVFVQTAG